MTASGSPATPHDARVVEKATHIAASLPGDAIAPAEHAEFIENVE